MQIDAEQYAPPGRANYLSQFLLESCHFVIKCIIHFTENIRKETYT